MSLYWVCQVLSPGTIRIHRVGKLPINADAGAQHAWLLGSGLHTVEVFENRDSKSLLRGALENDDRVRVATFDAIELALSSSWAD